MRWAGVRLPDGRTVWADAGEEAMAPLDRATIRLDGGESEGLVLIAPEQFLGPPTQVEGAVVRVQPAADAAAACDDLPGAGLPPLGTTVRGGTWQGRVVAIDPVHGRVTVDTGSETLDVLVGDISDE